ncbi:hypothetical protein HPP92_007424 [Vanilla planifolia]|uniref:Uncharacterized protein n=1 Tax=Vanilla planifolia TaxID=51239 RepID=A0A835RMB1_VANPL|nr:hypothetical protein HPP92_007619 [Vanilla planifolia]KAG0490561.1 hypothetical protein HPP92_007424 [Vanilla planifolia]
MLPLLSALPSPRCHLLQSASWQEITTVTKRSLWSRITADNSSVYVVRIQGAGVLPSDDGEGCFAEEMGGIMKFCNRGMRRVCVAEVAVKGGCGESQRRRAVERCEGKVGGRCGGGV